MKPMAGLPRSRVTGFVYIFAYFRMQQAALKAAQDQTHVWFNSCPVYLGKEKAKPVISLPTSPLIAASINTLAKTSLCTLGPWIQLLPSRLPRPNL